MLLNNGACDQAYKHFNFTAAGTVTTDVPAGSAYTVLCFTGTTGAWTQAGQKSSLTAAAGATLPVTCP
jgi:hypothetical protein